MKLKNYPDIFTCAVKQSIDDNLPRLGASFTFYSLLSFGPLLIFIAALISYFFGADETHAYIMNAAYRLLSQESYVAVADVLKPPTGQNDIRFALIILNSGLLLFGALGAFNEFQDAFNTIWKVQLSQDRPIIRILKERFSSFVMVLGTGFLLITSLVINTVLTAAEKFTLGIFPAMAVVMQVVNLSVGFAVMIGLFALIYKTIPDTKVAWRDVWLGAIIASLLFTIGQWAVSFYIGQSGITSRFGAAGSLVALLIWIYYTAQITFFGAEISHAYAYCYGSYQKQIFPKRL